MLVSASSEARELKLAVDNRIGGDSNVFRSSRDKKSDGFYALAPQLTFRERHSDLNYDFYYQPTYEAYFKSSGIDGFDHLARGSVDWGISPADSLSMFGRYSNTRRIQLEDQTVGGIPVPEESDRVRLRTGDARVSYTRMLSPVLSLQTTAGFDDFASSSDSDLDSRAYLGQVGAQYDFDPRTSAGLWTSFRYRETGGASNQFTTDTQIWDFAASARRALTPTMTISLQAGPSFVSTKQKPPSGTSLSTRYTSDVSYFASAELRKDWQRSDFSVSYTRSESRGGGSSSSAFVDNVGLNFHHFFDRVWKLRLYGSWTQRKEITAVPGSPRVDTTVYQAIATLTRRITSRVSVIVQYNFLNQDQDGSTSSSSIGQLHSGFVALRYEFEPVVF